VKRLGLILALLICGAARSLADATPIVGPPDYRLVAAVEKGDHGRVLQLLKRGIDVNSTNERGTTALMTAVCTGSHSLVKLLLARGANIHAKQDNDFTAFGMIPYSTPECAEELARREPLQDKNLLNHYLLNAVRFSNARMVAWLLGKGADPNYRDRSGYCATGMTREQMRNYRGPSVLRWARMMAAVTEAEKQSQRGAASNKILQVLLDHGATEE
jgi:ankyrin repeat protein